MGCLLVCTPAVDAGRGWFPCCVMRQSPLAPSGPRVAPPSPPPPPAAGLFYFDASYRPVPLEMQFVGVSERNVMARMNIQDEICYQKVGHQVQSCV